MQYGRSLIDMRLSLPLDQSQRRSIFAEDNRYWASYIRQSELVLQRNHHTHYLLLSETTTPTATTRTATYTTDSTQLFERPQILAFLFPSTRLGIQLTRFVDTQHPSVISSTPSPHPLHAVDSLPRSIPPLQTVDR